MTSAKARKAVYPGTFDPITNGHLDIIQRALKIFDEIIVLIVDNKNKKALFTLSERADLIKECCKGMNVKVETFTGLLADYMKKQNTNIVVRGLRAVSDFEYEFQMAVTNSKLNPEMETIFLMTDKRYFYLSSSIVKEIGLSGGCVKTMVPDAVEKALKKKT